MIGLAFSIGNWTGMVMQERETLNQGCLVPDNQQALKSIKLITGGKDLCNQDFLDQDYEFLDQGS